ncbi:MAG: methyltransferase domain-containing protein [Clostridiales bacterium]|nr:methyltransferase domain-containing protein [Clostridiales bacterium]
MTIIRPGGLALTKKAIEKAALPQGARVLDIGCGEGDTVALLASDYGFNATGVDVSTELIDKAKSRHPDLDFHQMEAELLDFDSKSFDGIFMECSLSVFRLHEDAAFEAYCLLKPGGKLIITDLYIKNPDPAAVAQMLNEAAEKANKPRAYGDCAENEKPSFVMLNDAFVVDELAGMLEDMGFILEHYEDESPALASFAAEAIMAHGSLEAYFKAVTPEGEDPASYCACSAFSNKDSLGYFLMILKKPAT